MTRKIGNLSHLFYSMRPFLRYLIFAAVATAALILFLIWILTAVDSDIKAVGENELSKVAQTTEMVEADSSSSNSPPNRDESQTPTVVGGNQSATSTRPKSTVKPTKLPSPAATSLPRLTQIPTSTPSPSSTPTQVLSPTLEPTKFELSTIQDNIDRTCPNPAPEKPDYEHYFLSGQSWPVPAPKPQEHFWLAKPLPGGGRVLFTDWLPYGYDAGGRYLLHNGVDVADPLGTPLLAAADGRIIAAGPDDQALYGWRCDWYGNLVVLELDQLWGDQPVYVLYGHVLGIVVEAGQQVVQGERLAEVGFGGAASNPHLHLEVRVGTNEFGSTRNPFLWMRPPDTRGLVVGRLIDPQGRPWQGVTIAAVGRSDGAENKTTWSYLGDPQNLINPDEEYAENFLIADLKPGSYEIYVEIQGESYQVPVEVLGGQIATVEIITAPFKNATAEAQQPAGDIGQETPTPDN